MSSINMFKSKFVLTSAWFAENPVRIQVAILTVSTLAVALMMVMGASAGSLIAGPSGGGAGGSG